MSTPTAYGRLRNSSHRARRKRCRGAACSGGCSTGNAMAMPSDIQPFRLSEQYQALKTRLHRHLLALIDERNLGVEQWSRDKLAEFVREQVKRYVFEQKLAVNQREAETLAADALDELAGFGPIQSLVD